MPEVVLQAWRRFEIEARGNVHEGAHRRDRGLGRSEGPGWRLLHAHSPEEVVFTYGTTSTLNLLAHSFGASLQPEDEILLSPLEHHSNLVLWQRLAAQRGLVLRFVPMTDDGRIDMDPLDSELTRRCRLVAMTHCSNVTGAITDISQLVATARDVGAKVLLDGAQRAPHGPLNIRELDVDFYAFSGHKTYGPKPRMPTSASLGKCSHLRPVSCGASERLMVSSPAPLRNWRSAAAPHLPRRR